MEPGLGLFHFRPAQVKLCGQRCLLEFDRRAELRQLGLCGSQAGLFPLALPPGLQRIETAESHALLDHAPFFRSQLDQLAGNFEGDLDFSQLDVAGNRKRIPSFPPTTRNPHQARQEHAEKHNHDRSSIHGLLPVFSLCSLGHGFTDATEKHESKDP